MGGASAGTIIAFALFIASALGVDGGICCLILDALALGAASYRVGTVGFLGQYELVSFLSIMAILVFLIIAASTRLICRQPSQTQVAAIHVPNFALDDRKEKREAHRLRRRRKAAFLLVVALLSHLAVYWNAIMKSLPASLILASVAAHVALAVEKSEEEKTLTSFYLLTFMSLLLIYRSREFFTLLHCPRRALTDLARLLSAGAIPSALASESRRDLSLHSFGPMNLLATRAEFFFTAFLFSCHFYIPYASSGIISAPRAGYLAVGGGGRLMRESPTGSGGIQGENGGPPLWRDTDGDEAHEFLIVDENERCIRDVAVRRVIADGL